MTFTVVSVVRETRAVLDRFVAWHLRLGADRILLCFDDPADPQVEAYGGDPRVLAIRCTDGFWRSVDVDPDAAFPLRQNAAATQGYREAQTAWVLYLDADELMHVEGRRAADLLAETPPEVGAVRVSPAEFVRVEGDAAAAFRVPIRRRRLASVYGEDARFFRLASGLTGHSAGKSFVRTGLAGVRLRQHWAVGPDGTRVPERALGAADGVFLLHFLQEEFAVWRAKVPWRMSAFGFPSEVGEEIRRTEVDGGDAEGALRDLHRRLSSLTPDCARRLEAAGGLQRFPIDFAAVAAGSRPAG